MQRLFHSLTDDFNLGQFPEVTWLLTLAPRHANSIGG
jgi:hypothetical protein